MTSAQVRLLKAELLATLDELSPSALVDLFERHCRACGSDSEPALLAIAVMSEDGSHGLHLQLTPVRSATELHQLNLELERTHARLELELDPETAVRS